jgi:hypothetical protein
MPLQGFAHFLWKKSGHEPLDSHEVQLPILSHANLKKSREKAQVFSTWKISFPSQTVAETPWNYSNRERKPGASADF